MVLLILQLNDCRSNNSCIIFFIANGPDYLYLYVYIATVIHIDHRSQSMSQMTAKYSILPNILPQYFGFVCPIYI